MTARFLCGIYGIGFIGCSLCLAAACNLPHTSGPSDAVSGTPVSASGRLAQVGFGGDARFAHCVPPACPTRTPKTFAPEAPNPPINSSAVFPPGKTLISGLPAPSATPITPASRTATVQFALGSARLSPTARSQLNLAMTDIAGVAGITIIGRTDSTGPLAFNESLAFARALAVRDHLLKTHPTLAPALTLKARGGCCFVAPNDTEAGRAQNRRVEVVFRMGGEEQP